MLYQIVLLPAGRQGAAGIATFWPRTRCQKALLLLQLLLLLLLLHATPCLCCQRALLRGPAQQGELQSDTLIWWTAVQVREAQRHTAQRPAMLRSIKPDHGPTGALHENHSLLLHVVEVVLLAVLAPHAIPPCHLGIKVLLPSARKGVGGRGPARARSCAQAASLSIKRFAKGQLEGMAQRGCCHLAPSAPLRVIKVRRPPRPSGGKPLPPPLCLTSWLLVM